MNIKEKIKILDHNINNKRTLFKEILNIRKKVTGLQQ